MSQGTNSTVSNSVTQTGLTDRKSSGSENQRTAGAASWAPAVRLACVVALVQLHAFSAQPVQGSRVLLTSHKRLTGDIYESIYSVRTGKGPHDRIQVHRVVREHRGEPIDTDKAVMLLHGDIWGFNGLFLGGGSPSFSLPVYLARQGTDVWGVDLAWTLVPKNTTDFTFMKTWDMQHDIDDVGEALDLARKFRKGHSPLALLGFSRGGPVAFGLLNQESQLPCRRRRVKGFISVDNFLKTNDPNARNFACTTLALFDARIAAGNYVNRNSVDQFGILAESNPTGVSPFIPPLTNYDASLFIGAVPFPSSTPFYHFVGGNFPQGDTTQVPTGLSYTDVPRWNAFLKAAGPYQPFPMLRDAVRISCGAAPPGPYDNHLSDIKVPVFYVAAAGGFGTSGLYTLSLLGSHDIESLVVRLRPPGEEALDFGHADLLYARDAQHLVWEKIDHWLASRGDDRVCSGRD